MTIQGSKGLRLPGNRELAQTVACKSEAPGSIPTGGNILLLDFFLFSRDAVEFYRMHLHLGKTQFSPVFVITTHIWSTRGGNIFTDVSPSTGGVGGVPQPQVHRSQVLSGVGVPQSLVPGPFQEGVPPSSVSGTVQTPVPGPTRGRERAGSGREVEGVHGQD